MTLKELETTEQVQTLSLEEINGFKGGSGEWVMFNGSMTYLLDEVTCYGTDLFGQKISVMDQISYKYGFICEQDNTRVDNPIYLLDNSNIGLFLFGKNFDQPQQQYIQSSPCPACMAIDSHNNPHGLQGADKVGGLLTPLGEVFVKRMANHSSDCSWNR